MKKKVPDLDDINWATAEEACEDSFGDGPAGFVSFSYGDVEAALAKMHDIDEQSIGAFRGRIKNFQRLGIVPASPGKGKKVSYRFLDVIKWGLCLELAEFGMSPEHIKRSIDALGDRVLAVLKKPREQGHEDLLLRVAPSLLRPSGTKAEIRDLPSAEDLLLKTKHYRRQMIINLSVFRNDLLSALDSVLDEHNPRIEDPGDDRWPDIEQTGDK